MKVVFPDPAMPIVISTVGFSILTLSFWEEAIVLLQGSRSNFQGSFKESIPNDRNKYVWIVIVINIFN